MANNLLVHTKTKIEQKLIYSFSINFLFVVFVRHKHATYDGSDKEGLGLTQQKWTSFIVCRTLQLQLRRLPMTRWDIRIYLQFSPLRS